MVTSSPGELVLWFVTWGQGEENIIGGGGSDTGWVLGWWCSWYMWGDACCVDIVYGTCVMVYVVCYICFMYSWCV